jgi:O-antigen/teichoic acid export membrane protein
MIGLACVSQEFVPVVLGEKWLAATFPLALLSFSVPFRGLTSFIRQVMGGIGHADLTLKSTVITWIVFFSSIVVGVNHGVPGLVAAVLITEPLIAIITVGLCKKSMETSYYRIAHALIPAISCCALMSISVLGAREILLGHSKVIMLFVEVSIGVIVYTTALRALFARQFTEALRLFKH